MYLTCMSSSVNIIFDVTDCGACSLGVHHLRVEPVGAESSLETSNCCSEV